MILKFYTILWKKKQNLTAFYKLLVLDELWAVEDGTSSKFKNCQK